MSLTLLHEFAENGFAEMECTDSAGTRRVQTSRTHFGGDLRITAIKLGEFQNGPLLQ